MSLSPPGRWQVKTLAWLDGGGGRGWAALLVEVESFPWPRWYSVLARSGAGVLGVQLLDSL